MTDEFDLSLISCLCANYEINYELMFIINPLFIELNGRCARRVTREKSIYMKRD